MKSDRKRSSVQKSPDTKPGVGSMSLVNAEVLKVRRPVLQDDDSDDATLPSLELATSQLQQVASDQQGLMCGIPTAESMSATDAQGKLTSKQVFRCIVYKRFCNLDYESVSHISSGS